MALRPIITAGVAFAAAGAVAATVAIAPPMSPRDVKVAKDTDVALNALITDPVLVPLINGYFNKPPQGILTGATGVVQQLVLAATSGNPIVQELANLYMVAGATPFAQVLATALAPGFADQINTIFAGGVSELTREQLLGMTNDLKQRDYINTYFGGEVNDNGWEENIAQVGVQGLLHTFLADRGLSVEQRQVLDTFWNAPTVYNSQATPVTSYVYKKVVDEEGVVTYVRATEPKLNPDGTPVLDEDGDPVMQYVLSEREPILDADGNMTFDENGNQVFGDLYFRGNSNPARRGSFGVLYNTIKGTGLSPDQEVTLDEYWDGGATEVIRNRLVNAAGDPIQKALVETYFDGGIDEIARLGLLTFADANTKNLINEFFDNGITGVIRHILVEPKAPAPAPNDPDDTPGDGEDPGDGEGEGDGEGDDTTTLADKSAPEAAPAVAPAAAPAPAPAAAPAAPESITKLKEEVSDEDEAATNVKSGNKVEPVIILPGGSNSTGSRGGGAWGWKGVADRVNGFVKSVEKATGGAPSAADPGGAGDAGDSDGGGDSE
jgi:hypothetical protein